MTANIEDYSAAIVIPKMVKYPALKGGHPVQKNGRLVRYAGGFCVVYPYDTPRGKFAVRLWHTPVGSVRGNLEVIFSALKKINLPYFVPCRYVSNAIMTAKGPQSAVVMNWIEAKSLKRHIETIIGKPHALDTLAASFLKMVKDLHAAKISHGDLQHGNILVRQDGSLVLVDYDSMYVPGMKEVPDEIKGLSGYQHPARLRQRFRSPTSDYFSELIIYTSIRALARHPYLWRKYNLADSETLLFTDTDFQSMGLTDIFRILETDCELRPLGRAIKDALRESSLGRIVPLEGIVNGQSESIVANISKRWETPHTMVGAFQSNIDLFNQLSEIVSRW